MAISEKKAQIYLPLRLFGALKKEAAVEKKSIAHVIREAIAAHLEERRRRKVDWEKDPLNSIIGLGNPAVHDAAAHHDQHLYSWDKKRR